MDFNFINSWTDLAINKYHVNPVIFVSIYLLSIPFFYISFYHVVEELVIIRKEKGKITPQHFIEGKKLSLWFSVLSAVYLSPYIYIALWGDNLPWWVWVIISVTVIVVILGLYYKIFKRVTKK